MERRACGSRCFAFKRKVAPSYVLLVATEGLFSVLPIQQAFRGVRESALSAFRVGNRRTRARSWAGQFCPHREQPAPHSGPHGADRLESGHSCRPSDNRVRGGLFHTRHLSLCGSPMGRRSPRGCPTTQRGHFYRGLTRLTTQSCVRRFHGRILNLHEVRLCQLVSILVLSHLTERVAARTEQFSKRPTRRSGPFHFPEEARS